MEDTDLYLGHLVYLWPFGIFMAIWYIYGHLVYFMTIWSISRPFGIYYGILEEIVVLWYMFTRFGTL
jgi:hypothetical protein